MISESSINKYEAMQKVKKTIESCKTRRQINCAANMFKNLVRIGISMGDFYEIKIILDDKIYQLKYQGLK